MNLPARRNTFLTWRLGLISRSKSFEARRFTFVQLELFNIEDCGDMPNRPHCGRAFILLLSRPTPLPSSLPPHRFMPA